MYDLGVPGVWWLISIDDARRIAAALEHIEAHLATPESCKQEALGALHLLNSGLRRTGAVPADFREART